MKSAGAKRLYIISATFAVAVIILVLSVIAPVLSTGVDFSIYNRGWNGTSDLAVSAYRSGRLVPTFTVSSTDSDLEVVHLPLDAIGLNPETSSLIVIGPSKPFTMAEGRLVGDFVRNGGRLLLADDFGSGNSLLRYMNSTCRFSGGLMMDLSFEKQPEFSVCFDIADDENITAGVITLLMNFPSSIDIGRNTQVLARSSVASYLDLDGNHLKNWTEPRGPFPVIAIESLGSGQILLMSDPSILINGMLKNADNEILTDNIMFFLGAGRTQVFFDESHRNYLDPVTMSIMALGEMNDFLKAAVVGLIGLVLLSVLTDYPRRAMRWAFVGSMKLLNATLGAILRIRRREEKEVHLSNDELIVAVMQRHPEWKLGLLRMLLKQTDYHRNTEGW